MLWNPVPPSFQQLNMNRIIPAFQFVDERDEHRAVLSHCEPSDILEEHCSRSEVIDDAEEASPEIGPLIPRLPASRPYKVPDLGHAGLGERLAWWSTGQEVDLVDSPLIEAS
jgi:hypothetical protein